MKYKLGDRVRLKPSSRYWGQNTDREGDGKEYPGAITYVPDSVGSFYRVRWDCGLQDGYPEDDLYLSEPFAEEYNDC